MLYSPIDGDLDVYETALKLRAFMKEYKTIIHHLVFRAESLSHMIQEQSPKFVLCHSDIHGGNVLIDESGAIYIVFSCELFDSKKQKSLEKEYGEILYT